jgi:azurin
MLALLVGAAPLAHAADEQAVTIGTLHGQLKYDVESFRVRPGATVRLTLKNTDEMQHNLLILAPGENKPLEVAQRAWALGADAVKKAFVPDGPDVLFHTRVVDPQQSDTITFMTPEKEGSYPFVCTLPGHAFSMKGVMQVDKAAAKLTTKAAKPVDAGNAKFHVHVMDEPVVIRSFIDGGPARSIAVGLPGGINYLFDAEACYVRFGWTGMFLDVGPNVGVNEGDRGGGWSRILGEKFELGDSGFPISIGELDARQVVKFAGYRMRGKEAPQFFFTIGGKRVTQTIRAATSGLGLQYDFEFERPPGKVFFYASPHFLQLTSSAGRWASGRLEVPAEQAQKFSVTIVRLTKDEAKLKTPAVAP